MPSIASRAPGLSVASGTPNEAARERQLIKGSRIPKREERHVLRELAAERLGGSGVRGQGLPRQGQGHRQGFDPFGPPLRGGFPKGPLAIKGKAGGAMP